MRIRSRTRAVVGGLLVLALAVAFTGGAQAQGVATTSGYGPAQGGFINNLGQWDPEARFLLDNGGLEMWLTETGFVYNAVDTSWAGQGAASVDISGTEPRGSSPEATVPAHAVRAEYVSGFPTGVYGTGQLPGEYNWLVGEESDWVRGAKAYETVQYADVWPGVDVVMTPVGAQSTDAAGVVKTSYLLDAGVDPAVIRVRYEGAESLSVDRHGRLVIETSLGDIVEDRPVAWQGGDEVAVSWNVEGEVASLAVGSMNWAQALTIDPMVFFSRLAGGSSTDSFADMHEDATGRYVTGSTASSNFPATSGAYDTSFNGSYDWFAMKFDPANDTLLWSTFIGGTNTEYGGDSTLAPNGELIISGSSYYPTSYGFPYVYRYYNPSYSTTYYEIGLFRLSANGSTRVSSALLAGPYYWYGAGVEIAPSGDVYVTGQAYYPTSYPWTNIGSSGGGYNTYGFGYYDAVIARLNGTFSSYLNATYTGGSTDFDGGMQLDFDASGNVYVVGNTYYSGWSGTPIGPGGNYDGFVAKYSPDLRTQYYNTRFGGSSTDPTAGYSYTSLPLSYYNGGGHQIAVDGSGQAWVTGMTASTDYPTTPGAYGTSNPGNYAVFVSAFNSSGSALTYSTMLGGSSTDSGRGIAFDEDGNVYVAGLTASTNFPAVNAEQGTNKGGYDFFRTILLPDLSDVICSTYWGSTSTDYGQSVIVDTVGQYRSRVGGTAYNSSYPAIPDGSPIFGGGGAYDIGIFDSTCGGALLEVGNEAFSSIPQTHLLDCITAGDIVVYTFDVTNTGLSDQPDNAGAEFSGVFSGPQVGVSCTTSSGTCTVTQASVEWNGSIPAGGVVNFEVRAKIRGGVKAGTALCIEGAVHFDVGEGENTASEEFEICTETNCPPTVDPNKQLGMQVHLPILNYLGNDDLCETWIEVQALGPRSMKAVLITWGEPGFCPPQAAGPLKVECTGLLKPGSTWNLMGDQIPSGSKGGMLFKFSTKQLSDVGLEETFGFDDILADLMCETLFFGVVGDADDYRRFKKAYNEGGNFGGIPQDIASGADDGGILAVDVLRDCPSPQAAGVRVTSKYNGIAGSHLGAFDPVYGGYMYYVPLVYADLAEFNSWIYIQNGGLECSSVEIWFKDQEECLRATVCEVSTLAPGETLQVDPNDCVNQFQGSAWIRTSQPMAVAVDITGRDVLMTYVGEPAELNYTFSPNQATYTPGNQVGFGPLIYSEYQGWDSGIQVQNLSAIQAAKVKVYFLDRSGDVITTLMDWICPRGSQTFFLPVVHDLPGNWVGSVRVESQEWITPGGPLVEPPNIVGVATLIKYGDAQRADTREAIAYNLLPEHKIFDWQLGFGGGDLDSGIGLIAIPSLLNDLDGTGVTSELAIANIVPKPGFTDFAIYIYDQNGLMDYVCQKLNEKQVEYIDLQTWGYIGNGFKGSAVISAVFWEHDVFDGQGFFLRNLVGLGAVAVERSKTRLGEDIAGDEAAGARGIPFKQSDIEDQEFEYLFGGEYPPLCPGVPGNLRQPPGEGPTCLGPVWGETVSAMWSTNQVPVPLWYSAGVCSTGTIQSTYALENPDVAWDGVDGQILTFINCSSGAEDITFTAPACSGPTPGQLITFYQTPDGAPDPWVQGSPCTNVIACQNPNIVGWCGTTSYGGSGCNYTVESGEFQVFVHCDYYAQSCPPGTFNYTFTQR